MALRRGGPGGPAVCRPSSPRSLNSLREDKEDLMGRIRFGMSVAVLLVGICAVSFAQTNSTLTGTVIHDGAPLPGVSVTVTSPSLQGSRTAVTGDNGTFFVAALPPGEYT